MKILKTLGNSVKKFLKGMFGLMVINGVLFVSVFIFDSCETSELEVNSRAKNRFLSSLEDNRTKIGSTSFISNSKNAKAEPITVYVEVPGDGPVPQPIANYLPQIASIDDLYDAVHDYGVVLQHQPSSTNTTYQFEIATENVVNSLTPVIAESKQYLYSKGLTDQDIQEMLTEHGGEETDLVPFVLSLIDIENGTSGPVARNYSGMFFTSAYATKAVDYKDYIDCALVAIGADVLFSLGASSAATWSKAAIKKAFGAVAKRALGPIGAAIAAVSFGVCLYDKYQ